MSTQLVEIQPRELKFVAEVKKQSSCTVHLANLSDQYVAFKVKTTSPKKYCVRPNVGIIQPKSTCDFIVTMQAPKSAPLDMQCKDKFLIQSTVVPFGTTDDEITPAMFAKDGQRYIEETKLRVVLERAPNSPEKLPADVVLKQEAPSQDTGSPKIHSSVLPPVNGCKSEQSYETSIPTLEVQNGVENPPPTDTVNKKVEAIKNVKNIEESRSFNVMDNMKSASVKYEVLSPDTDDESKTQVNKKVESRSLHVPENMKSASVKHESFFPDNDDESKTQVNKKVQTIKNVKNTEESRSLNVVDNMKPDKDEESKTEVNKKVEAIKDANNTEDFRSVNVMDDMKSVPVKHKLFSPDKNDEIKFKLAREVEELRSKITAMDAKLAEAQQTIEKLNKEKSIAVHEKETLKQQLAMSRSRNGGGVTRKVHVGFPPLFVCMVALISLMLGLFFRF